MDSPAPREPARPSTDWARLGRGTVIPILLLVGLLVILGHVHIDLATGYTAPRVVADGQDVFVFFDEGGRDPAFYFRRSDDAGRTWSTRKRVEGVLGGAVMQGERLVALLADQVEGGQARWFYSFYDKKTLDRPWSGSFDDPDLGLVHPRHLARLGDAVLAFGTDADGALRVGRLGESRAMVPVDAKLPGAALPPKGDPPAKVPPPVYLTSVEVRGAGPPHLLVFWRVLADPAGSRGGPGELRWTTFDGQRFGELARFSRDLLAAAAVTSPSGEVLLLGTPQGASGDEESSILVWRVGASSEVVERVAYEREGFTGAGGVAALGAAAARDRLLLVAQIGGSIRYRAKENGAWQDWQDIARLAAEQKAVVYGWGLSLLALAGALVVQGLRALRNRRPRPPAPRSLDELCARALEERARAAGVTPPPAAPDAPPRAPAPAAEPATATATATAEEAEAEEEADLPEAAPLPERCLAFLIDLSIVLVGFALLAGAVPGVLERAKADPRVQIALWGLFVFGVVAYFALLETLFARTPGKRLLDLEVQDLLGGRPTRGALLFRNLFRIELLLPPPYLALLVSFLIMLVSPQRQRPGDFVARTAVRRARVSAA